MNEDDKISLESALRDCFSVLKDGSVINYGLRGPAPEAMFCWMILNLHDGLQILRRNQLKIAFTDDVEVPNKPNADVTDLVSDVRNAVCHPASPKHLVHNNNFTRFMVVQGGAGPIFETDVKSYECKYPDDHAVIFGEFAILYCRHIARAAGEAWRHLGKGRPPI